MKVKESASEPMSLSMTKIGVLQKHSVVRTNLGDAITVVSAVGGERNWASDMPFRQVPRLGAKTTSNEHNVR